MRLKIFTEALVTLHAADSSSMHVVTRKHATTEMYRMSPDSTTAGSTTRDVTGARLSSEID
jgi:hypothetical protein